MNARAKIMFACILALVAGLQYYIGWHGWLLLSEGFGLSRGKGVYWAVFWIVAFGYFIARPASRLLPHMIYKLLKLLGSYWIAVMQYSVLLLPAADLAGVCLHWFGVSPSVYVPSLGIAVIGIIAAVLTYGSRNAWSPVIRRYELRVDKPAGSFEELRIAVASDLHLGTIVGTKHLQRLVDRVNAMEPDLILFPGDVLDDEIGPFIRYRMGELMGQLRAKLGIYAVLGNHEYYGGDIDEYVRQMDNHGIEVLMDRSVKIADSLYIIGRKDLTATRLGGRRKELAELLGEDVDQSLPLIMMDHQPYRLDAAAEAGIDIMLSGHTHRGQMLPNHLITRRIFELDWGYLRKGAMHAVVSSGFGTWGPPIRIGSRSEIIELAVKFRHAADTGTVRQDEFVRTVAGRSNAVSLGS